MDEQGWEGLRSFCCGGQYGPNSATCECVLLCAEGAVGGMKLKMLKQTAPLPLPEAPAYPLLAWPLRGVGGGGPPHPPILLKFSHPTPTHFCFSS